MSESSLSAFGLVGVHGLAKLLDVSEVTVRRMRDEGRMPMSIRVGGTKQNERWRIKDIQEWLDRGCPRVVVDESDASREGE